MIGMTAYHDSHSSAAIVNPRSYNYTMLRAILRRMTKIEARIYDNCGLHKNVVQENNKYCMNIISIEADPQYHPKNWKKRSSCPIEIINFNIR